MKVLLLQDVKNVGRRNEVKNVNDGYANNFLIPQKKALPANDPKAKLLLGKNAQQSIANEEHAAALVAKLDGKTIQLTRPTNDSGSLYGKVSESDIAQTITKMFDCKVAANQVKFNQVIKHTGSYTITVQTGANGNQTATMDLKVIAAA
jgi:large subunit ribosomal protein L9